MQIGSRLILRFRRVLRIARKRRTVQKKIVSLRARARYLAERDRAREFVHGKLAAWNAHYGFLYLRVAIRDQRTRWGSASRKKNLNFNYRIVKLPEHLADYIIVHELCHLAHLNHSEAFWDAVARTIPDHRARRAELRAIRLRDLG